MDEQRGLVPIVVNEATGWIAKDRAAVPAGDERGVVGGSVSYGRRGHECGD